MIFTFTLLPNPLSRSSIFSIFTLFFIEFLSSCCLHYNLVLQNVESFRFPNYFSFSIAIPPTIKKKTWLFCLYVLTFTLSYFFFVSVLPVTEKSPTEGLETHPSVSFPLDRPRRDGPENHCRKD